MEIVPSPSAAVVFHSLGFGRRSRNPRPTYLLSIRPTGRIRIGCLPKRVFAVNSNDHPSEGRTVVETGIDFKNKAIGGSGERELLAGRISSSVPYLMEMGLDIDQIKGMVRKCPAFANYTLERNVKPLVEFLLELGMDRVDIPVLLYRRPKLCGAKIEITSRPTVEYIGSLGVEDTQWPKIIKRCPHLLSLRKEGIEATVTYLYELGLSNEDIRHLLWKYPHILRFNPEKRLRPTVEFFRSLGVNVPKLTRDWPQIFACSVEGCLMPKMQVLKGLFLEEGSLLKAIGLYPTLLLPSEEKIREIIDYFLELGIAKEAIGKVLIKHPNILRFSVNNKLRPVEKYFRSFGVDVANLISARPQVFGLSLERKIKPTTKFLLDEGFTIEDVRSVATRFGYLYGMSLENNLKLKLEFFRTTGYPRSELIKNPLFLSCSLEERLKPRYNRAKKCGVQLKLYAIVNSSDIEFDRILEKKMKTGV